MLPRKRDVNIRDERVHAAFEAYQQGKLTRREFIRYAAMMGASLAAFGISGCQPGTPTATPTPMPVATVAQAKTPTPEPTAKPEEPTAVPTPVSSIRRGGKLVSTLAFSTVRFTDPALLTDTFVANVVRQICDWLVRVGPDMVVRPALATAWTPSEDGLQWTINLRQGVKFNHGKEFNADDVVYTFNRLLDPNIASAFSSVANYLKPGAVEKVDDYTVVFNCERSVGDFPFHLFDYHAAILPADWTGDFYEAPWGTGPFELAEFRADELIRFKRRKDYWGMGEDGQPLPYLDEVEVRGYPDQTAFLEALQKGDVHVGGISVATLPQVLQWSNVRPVVFQTGHFFNGVLHCNEKPFDDVRVRQAFKLCMDRQAHIDTVLLGYGIPAYDQPISPIYELAPELTPTPLDYDKAKALLAEAGYPNGMDLTCQFYADQFHTDNVTWMQASAEPGGFRITLQPNPEYWQVWLSDWGEFVIGADNWAMRATPSEFFNIAYKSGGDWNETHWSNPRFDELLAQYDAELDAAARKAQLAEMCQIIQEDGGVVIPSYRQDLQVVSTRLRNYEPHPLVAMWYADLWLAEEEEV